MSIVWDNPDSSVAQIWQVLLSRDRNLARNTVQTTLTRLCEKGWLRHRREGNTFYFTAARPRRRAVKGLLSRLVRQAFDGSAGQLVLALLRHNEVSAEEAEQIRRLIDQSRPPHRPPHKEATDELE
jgi:predicted transcriptional regulator